MEGRTADVVVIGAGAAGLMAALQAARAGARTVLLEKNARPGLKILISGGGRCNLTTTKRGKDLEAQYGKRRGRWLRHSLRSFTPEHLIEIVEGAGVPLREEDLDKIFPVSGKSRDVLNAFVGLCERAGVDLRTEARVSGIERVDGEPADGGFVVHSAGGSVGARAVVLCTGGLSYPKTGATGDGYGFVQALGHDLTATHPHLAPLPVDAAWVHSLAGIVLEAATIAALDPDGRELCRRRRPVLFTHKGLSGPGAMDLAGFVEEAGGCEVSMDLVPDERLEDLETGWLAAVKQNGKRHAASLLPRALPERLRNALAERAGADGCTVAELPKANRRHLLRALKDCRVRVDRSFGYAQAEVTRGGVPLEEVDAKTMASKLCPGLYLCGEILDIDGPIGGFNFQAAFATGRLAGMHAASRD